MVGSSEASQASEDNKEQSQVVPRPLPNQSLLVEMLRRSSEKCSLLVISSLDNKYPLSIFFGLRALSIRNSQVPLSTSLFLVIGVTIFLAPQIPRDPGIHVSSFFLYLVHLYI